jgi:hypothetical protein
MALWSIGLGSLAAVGIAASHGSPVEAVVPGNHAVPAAESVETVLRATYSLPSGRGRDLAMFLTANAAPGIDVRADEDRLTVVAPADAQKALGMFIEKCVSREPRSVPNPDDFDASPFIHEGAVPNYDDPAHGFRPETRVRKRQTGDQDHGFDPPVGDSPFMEGN